jgi:hypothetical protein
MTTLKIFLATAVLALSFAVCNGKISDGMAFPAPHIHAKFAYVTWTKEKGYDIKIFALGKNLADTNLDWVAKARYQNLVNKTGWAYVEVETKTTWPDEMQGFAAGMAEGYLTKDLIAYFWANMIEHYCDDKEQLCKNIDKYIKLNSQWTEKSTQKGKNGSPYWYQANLVIEQFKGLQAGYKKAAKTTDPQISARDFLLINILGDLGDLEVALNPKPSLQKVRDGHCSVLIKLIGQQDIYAGHVTWDTYSSMLRIIKRYNIGYKTSSAPGSPIVPGSSISFSSYPGMLHSMDDYYLSSSGLLVTETTIGNYNNDLWKDVQPYNSLLTGIRAMISTRLATDGKQWTTLFARYNSGTYNNQWIILNYNLFEPEKKDLQPGLLRILEQLPGYTKSTDLTSVLQRDGYFASYNVPYQPEIYAKSGWPTMVDKFGDWFTLNQNPRAKIFARDHGQVENLESMMKLMRYNDYQNDEYSKCNCTPPYSAENAISSRCDLNPANGTYPFKALGHRPHGATDMKVTDLDMFILQRFVAIAGPTYDPLPPFQWSKSDFKDLPHHGQPDRFEFEPEIHQWKWL